MKIIVYVLIFLFSINLYSENEKNSFLIGLGNNQTKDNNLIIKVHQGMMFNFEYERENKTKYNSINQSQIGLGFSGLNTELESPFSSINITFNASHTRLFPLCENSNIRFLIGPDAFLNYNVSMFPNWDESHIYWANALGFGLKTKLEYYINSNNSIGLYLEIPVIYLLGRPEVNRRYKMDDLTIWGIFAELHSKMENGFLNNDIILHTDIEYKIVKKEKPYYICYSFDYSKLQTLVSKPFINIQHKIGVKVCI